MARSLMFLGMHLLATIATVSGAKVVMTSLQLGSHILEQLAIGEELVSRGHQVYVAIGSRYPKMKDIEKRGIKILQYTIPDDVLYGVSEDLEKTIAEIIFGDTQDKMSASGNVASEMSLRDCFYMANDDKFLSEARQIKFDIAVIEPFIREPCNLILPKLLGIRFCTYAGIYLPWQIRLPALPSFVPIMEVWTDVSDITLLGKLKNLAWLAFGEKIINQMAPQNTSLLTKYAPEFENWNELLLQSEIFLVGNDHHLGLYFPVLPYYVSVAGLSTSKPKPLPQDLQEIVGSSQEDTILLSFGSAAYYFPENVVITFLEAFAKLKQTVIAKLHVPKGVKVPKNVKVLSWLPQNDILGHPDTRLFITHCGNSGQHEALYHGVPMIGFPLFAEQHRNCHRAYKLGFGLEMSIQSFTSEELVSNIKELLQNSKYRSAIKKASDIFRDQPMHPRERAAFWIEHVIRHGGGKHLRSLAMDMPLYEFLMLDILGIFIAVIIVAVLLMLLLCRRIFRRFSKTSSCKSSNPKLKAN